MHSSSVGPIDETQLFYLESRGIPPDEARKFIVLGFLEPVVARVPLEAARDRLRELLEAKWIAGTEGRQRRDRATTPAAATRRIGGRRLPASGGSAMRRIDLLGVDEVADGEMKMVVVDGTDQVLVINNGGEFTAVQGVCTHEYFELDKGFLTAGTLTCALHLSRFDLSDGEPLDPPAELPLEVYPVVVEDGRVLIEVPRRPAADQRGVGPAPVRRGRSASGPAASVWSIASCDGRRRERQRDRVARQPRRRSGRRSGCRTGCRSGRSSGRSARRRGRSCRSSSRYDGSVRDLEQAVDARPA